MEAAILVAVVCFLALAWITGPREDGLLRLQSPTEPSRLPVHAERLGLRLSEEGSRRLVGTVEGCRVEVEVTDGLWGLAVELPFWPPQGLRAEWVQAGGGSWAAGGFAERDLTWLITGPGVEAVMDRLRRKRWPLSVDREVRMRFAEPDAEVALEDAVALALALESRRYEGCVAVCARVGAQVLDPRTARRVVGSIDGVGVEVDLPEVIGTTWVARLHARWLAPLPRGTVLVRREDGRGRSAELGDLVLDTALHLRVGPGGERALRERLATDAVRGPLLDALCSWPGSEVTEHGVLLVLRDGALDLEPRLAELLELVRAVGS